MPPQPKIQNKVTGPPPPDEKGLYFANMGSVYDVPVSQEQKTQRTQASSAQASFWKDKVHFEKTERAVR
jgi:hypothetical protein